MIYCGKRLKFNKGESIVIIVFCGCLMDIGQKEVMKIVFMFGVGYFSQCYFEIFVIRKD